MGKKRTSEDAGLKNTASSSRFFEHGTRAFENELLFVKEAFEDKKFDQFFLLFDELEQKFGKNLLLEFVEQINEKYHYQKIYNNKFQSKLKENKVLFTWFLKKLEEYLELSKHERNTNPRKKSKLSEEKTTLQKYERLILLLISDINLLPQCLKVPEIKKYTDTFPVETIIGCIAATLNYKEAWLAFIPFLKQHFPEKIETLQTSPLSPEFFLSLGAHDRCSGNFLDYILHKDNQLTYARFFPTSTLYNNISEEHGKDLYLEYWKEGFRALDTKKFAEHLFLPVRNNKIKEKYHHLLTNTDPIVIDMIEKIPQEVILRNLIINPVIDIEFFNESLKKLKKIQSAELLTTLKNIFIKTDYSFSDISGLKVHENSILFLEKNKCILSLLDSVSQHLPNEHDKDHIWLYKINSYFENKDTKLSPAETANILLQNMVHFILELTLNPQDTKHNLTEITELFLSKGAEPSQMLLIFFLTYFHTKITGYDDLWPIITPSVDLIFSKIPEDTQPGLIELCCRFVCISCHEYQEKELNKASKFVSFLTNNLKKAQLNHQNLLHMMNYPISPRIKNMNNKEAPSILDIHQCSVSDFLAVLLYKTLLENKETLKATYKCNNFKWDKFNKIACDIDPEWINSIAKTTLIIDLLTCLVKDKSQTPAINSHLITNILHSSAQRKILVPEAFLKKLASYLLKPDLNELLTEKSRSEVRKINDWLEKNPASEEDKQRFEHIKTELLKKFDANPDLHTQAIHSRENHDYADKVYTSWMNTDGTPENFALGRQFFLDDIRKKLVAYATKNPDLFIDITTRYMSYTRNGQDHEPNELAVLRNIPIKIRNLHNLIHMPLPEHNEEARMNLIQRQNDAKKFLQLIQIIGYYCKPDTPLHPEYSLNNKDEALNCLFQELQDQILQPSCDQGPFIRIIMSLSETASSNISFPYIRRNSLNFHVKKYIEAHYKEHIQDIYEKFYAKDPDLNKIDELMPEAFERMALSFFETFKNKLGTINAQEVQSAFKFQAEYGEHPDILEQLNQLHQEQRTQSNLSL